MSDVPHGMPANLSKLWEDMYFGNGKPGVTTRLALLENGQERTEAALTNFTESVNKKLGRMTLAFVVAALALVGNLIVLVVKH